MPHTIDGKRLDIILNPLGVINRLNISQLYEIDLNALSNFVVSEMRKMYENDYDNMVEYFFDYIFSVNENEYNHLVDYYNELSEEDEKEFWNSIFTEGIYLHQAPFWGNLDFDDMKKLHKKYPGCKPEKFVEIERPIMAGELYMIKLKHEASKLYFCLL